MKIRESFFELAQMETIQGRIQKFNSGWAHFFSQTKLQINFKESTNKIKLTKIKSRVPGRLSKEIKTFE